jgi:hypothetical protein
VYSVELCPRFGNASIRELDLKSDPRLPSRALGDGGLVAGLGEDDVTSVDSGIEIIFRLYA